MDDPNRILLGRAADLLAPLANDLVFVGGCAAGLLITDFGAGGIRATFDVDTIVQVARYVAYARLGERLRQCGFSEASDEAVICRWRHGDLVLDGVPTGVSVLGFSNRWYADALTQATWVRVDARAIRLTRRRTSSRPSSRPFTTAGMVMCGEVTTSRTSWPSSTVGRRWSTRWPRAVAGAAVRGPAGAHPARHTHVP